MADDTASNTSNAGAGLFPEPGSNAASTTPTNAGAAQGSSTNDAQGSAGASTNPTANAGANAGASNDGKVASVLAGAQSKEGQGSADGKANDGKAGDDKTKGGEQKTPEQLEAEKKAADEAAKKAEAEKNMTPEQKAKAEADAKVPEKPEDYKFEMPKGMETNKEMASKFAKVAHELKIPQGKVQEFASMGAELVQKAVESTTKTVTETIQNQFKETHEGWISSLKADKTYGGPNYEKTVEKANWALLNLIPEAYRNQAEGGLRDNPLTLIALSLAADKNSEDKVAAGSTNGSQSSGGGLFGNI